MRSSVTKLVLAAEATRKAAGVAAKTARKQIRGIVIAMPITAHQRRDVLHTGRCHDSRCHHRGNLPGVARQSRRRLAQNRNDVSAAGALAFVIGSRS